MAISKVTLNGVTLMDVTSDTVEANTLLSGNTATKNDGTKVTGSYTPVTPTYQEKTISPTTSVQVVTPDTTYDALSQVTVNAMSLTEKTVTPSSQVQIVTAGTEMIENLIGFSGTSEGSDTDLTITKNGETISRTYTTDGKRHTAIYDEDAGKQYKVWFRIKKWFIGPTSDYEYGTPLEFEVIDTFYSNGNYKDIIIPVNDPDGVVTSIRVNRENYYNIRLIFSGGSSIPSGKNHIKYVSNIYSVEEAHYDALSQVTVNAIPSEYVVPTGTLAISQNGTVNVKNYEYANVNVEGGGGGTTADESLPVRFLDYDGTVVYSCTAEDFANLTAMPSNPSHTGLTAQGWNWTLADAKTQVAEMGACDIGQMYVTDDGKTRIYCHFEEGRLAPYLGIGVNGTVVVDWGDGSATDTLTGTSLTTVADVQHTYASKGDYVIALTVSSGSFSFYGTSNTSYILRKDQTTTAHIHKVYANTIQKIELGDGANIGYYAFNNCYSLSSITIPSGVTSIGNNAFYNCNSLSSITIPSGVTSIGTNVFYYCYSLLSVSIPNGVTSIGSSVFYYCTSLPSVSIPSGVTSIGSNVFYYCYSLSSVAIPNGVTSISAYIVFYCSSLSSITIPSGVTSIGNNAFNSCYSLSGIITIPSGVTSIGNSVFRYCYGVADYHILPTTPPTLGTNSFDGIQPDCKIYVPSASLETYKTATNWSTYADYMVGE